MILEITPEKITELERELVDAKNDWEEAYQRQRGIIKKAGSIRMEYNRYEMGELYRAEKDMCSCVFLASGIETVLKAAGFTVDYEYNRDTGDCESATIRKING